MIRLPVSAGMARPLRVEYPGAAYHIMARGNQGRPIFKDDLDRKRFLETLAEACEKTGWRICAYVLMGNHYHLLAQTPEANLVAGMKWLQGTYTQRYNYRHEVFGHLFQGRYKAIPVDGRDINYLQVVSTYIHLNPARAGLIRVGQAQLESYPWSSYPLYLNRRAPAWLNRESVLASLGLRPSDGQGYAAYLEARVLELELKAGRKELDAQWQKLRRGWYVGGQSFREQLQAGLEQAAQGRQRESHSGPARTAHDLAAAERMTLTGLQALGLNSAELLELPKIAPEKTALAWWLRRRTTVTLRWVSQRLGLGHYTRVSKAVSRMDRQPGGKLRLLRDKLLALEEDKK